MSLQQLSAPTQSKLRSSQILTSLPQAVSELLQNALDACATHVRVGVDCVGWECWVMDDGKGISRDGLEALTMGRYNSSKAYTPASLDHVSTFGFRGEALASAADVSCLEIASRTARARESRTIILKNGKCLYDGPSTRWRRERPGTVVCLRDVFYNLPLRRTTHPSPAKTLEVIRRELETYALVFPHVSFSLEDISPSKAGLMMEKKMVLRIPKTRSSLASFRHIYGRALAEHVEDVDVSSGGMHIAGFMSLNGALSKSHQYIYVNRHPLAPCQLHRQIDLAFSNSSFGKHALDEDGGPSQPYAGKCSRSSVMFYFQHLFEASRRSPRKAERKPVFMFNITLPPANVDNGVEPAKTAVLFQNDEAVVSLVTSVVRGFLDRNGFSTTLRGEQGQSAPSPRKRRRVETTPSLDPTPRSPSGSGVKNSSLDPDANSLYIPHHNVSPDPDNNAEPQKGISWTDPRTGMAYIVDPRTGNSYSRHANSEGGSGGQGAARRTLPVEGGLDEATPAWITDVLRVNSAYRAVERRIPCTATPIALPHEHQHEANKLEATLGRADLAQAEVLGQIDRKFVVCVVRREKESMLVVLDQHAASERVRVERFFAELCAGFLSDQGEVWEGWKTEVRPARPVLLTRHEAELLWDEDGARELLERWGFGFVRGEPAEGAGEGEGYAQVLVCHVPTVVSEKLLTANELHDLLKGFLAAWNMGDYARSSVLQPDPTEEGDEFPWQKALRWCPRGLIELVNSRACRGAIMFNDPLTHAQCVKLVGQLARTAFPFQCAHGRPSLVPLASFPLGERQGQRGGKVDWARMRLPGKTS